LCPALFRTPNKSGKHTFQKGYFGSGCAKSMKEGLEISGMDIGDVDKHTAFYLEAVQRPNKQSLEQVLFQDYAQIRYFIIYIRVKKRVKQVVPKNMMVKLILINLI